MGDDEMGDVVGGDGNGSRRKCSYKLKLLGRRGAELISGRHVRFPTLRQRLAEGGVLHVQRLIDVLLDVLFKRLAGNALNDISGKRRGVVRICRDLAWRINTPWLMVD